MERQKMAMSTCKNLLLFIFLAVISFASYAENIDITSIQSSEGASLNCSDSADLTLQVFGESQQFKITASKEGGYIIISQSNIKYNMLLSPESVNLLIPSLQTTTTSYFIDGRPLSGPAVETKELDYVQEFYNLLKTALNEAHEMKKCLAWNL